MHQSLRNFCIRLEKSFDQIPEKRKQALRKLSGYLAEQWKEGKTPQAIVICTHNSRRSHIGQLWLAAGADYYQTPALRVYSGGTEATAFNPRAVEAMKRAGFQITTAEEHSENPVYQASWKQGAEPLSIFSKRYEDPPNPTSGFAAIMVCSEADAGCPVVFGAALRLSLPFDDPKAFDGTDLEEEKYDERVEDIGREMLYAISQAR